jgi:hypothetical protein
MPIDSYVSIKLPKEVYDLVAERARAEERSVTAEVRRLLKRSLTEADELPRAA